MNKLRVCFAGTPEFAAAHLNALITAQTEEASRFELVAVYTQPDRPAGRGKKLSPSPVKRTAMGAGLRILQPSTLRSDEAVAELKGEKVPDPVEIAVDVPGDALRLVVITRLPFRVPNEPLQQARHARIEAEGGRPFFELTLPEAILRLRQGFGRLIRHRTDRGAVVVLDPRLDTARYGRRFVQALPPARRVRGPMHVVVEAVREVTVGTPRPEQSQ